jgi:hypothetical protein
MKKPTLKPPKRYTLLMNNHPHERVSKCPQCRKLTHRRKFPLLIWIDDGAAGIISIVLGKTGPYCTPCELIVVHRHEVAMELNGTEALDGGELGERAIHIAGTVDTKLWKAGLHSTGLSPSALVEAVTEFKKRLDLHVEPGGWFRSEDRPHRAD